MLKRVSSFIASLIVCTTIALPVFAITTAVPYEAPKIQYALDSAMLAKFPYYAVFLDKYGRQGPSADPSAQHDTVVYILYSKTKDFTFINTWADGNIDATIYTAYNLDMSTTNYVLTVSAPFLTGVAPETVDCREKSFSVYSAAAGHFQFDYYYRIYSTLNIRNIEGLKNLRGKSADYEYIIDYFKAGLGTGGGTTYGGGSSGSSGSGGPGSSSSDPGDGYVPVRGITAPASITVISGKSITTNALVTPNNADNKAVNYSITDTSIASFQYQSGSSYYITVYGVRVGTTLLRSTSVDGGYTATTIVNVIPDPDDPGGGSSNPGGSDPGGGSVLPSSSSPIWSSSSIPSDWPDYSGADNYDDWDGRFEYNPPSDGNYAGLSPGGEYGGDEDGLQEIKPGVEGGGGLWNILPGDPDSVQRYFYDPINDSVQGGIQAFSAPASGDAAVPYVPYDTSVWTLFGYTVQRYIGAAAYTATYPMAILFGFGFVAKIFKNFMS